MFWIVAAVVVVTGFAVAWVSSGRKAPGGPGDHHDAGVDEARAQAHYNRSYNPNGPGIGPSGF